MMIEKRLDVVKDGISFMDIRYLAKYKKQGIIAAIILAAAVGTGVAVSVSGSSVAEKSEEMLAKVGAQANGAAGAQGDISVLKNLRLADEQEVEQLIAFKKAGIEEYDMQLMPQTVVKGVSKTNTDNEQEQKPGTFKVALPEDKSKILKLDKGEASNPGTRSIADEVYTVFDERSGKYVTLSGHELLCQVVNSEIGDSWGEEAIKAQAVAAYSYIRFNDASGNIPTVGLRTGYSGKLERCISAVEGQCIYYNGSIIDAVYSASSAGASAPSVKIWGVSYPYLQAVESVYDSKDPNYGNKKTFKEEQLRKIIEGNTGIKLSDDPKNWFEIQSVFSGKYVDLMKLDGRETITVGGSARRVSGALMRSTILGTNNLKSTAFDISYDNGVFTFTTYGWGHGVGMSQWGACYYAKAGYSYDQILRHYYVNTTVRVSDVNSKAIGRTDVTKTQPQVVRDDEKPDTDTQQITDDKAEDTDSADTLIPEAETSATPSSDDESDQPAVTQAPEEEAPTQQQDTAAEKENESDEEAVPDEAEEAEGPQGSEDFPEEEQEQTAQTQQPSPGQDTEDTAPVETQTDIQDVEPADQTAQTADSN